MRFKYSTYLLSRDHRKSLKHVLFDATDKMSNTVHRVAEKEVTVTLFLTSPLRLRPRQFLCKCNETLYARKGDIDYRKF